MNKWFSISVLALGLAVSACGPTGSDSGSSDSCSSDNDCKGDRICEDRECVSPGGGDNGGGDNGGGGGGADTNNDNGGGGGGGGGADEYVAYCCVNGSFYGCDSAGDAEACVFEEGGEEQCTRDASFDASYCDDDGGGGGGGDTNNDNNGGGGGGSDKKATGETCEVNSECEGSVCLVRGSGDILGYCSNRCENFSDCPTFWDCEELANAAGKYCVED